MAASEQLLRLIERLKEIFEIDKSDLDFGIYRILNIRKKEIEKFLAKGLPKRVQETLAPFATDTSVIENRIREIEGQLGDSAAIAALPVTIPMVKEYAELKAQLAKGVDLSGLEADVYSHLLSFFSRYYEEGDFISTRRYKEGVYAIPYEGEEVKLHWANTDQYFIKTSENFKDYTFVAGEYTVHFRLVNATTEQNNNKETADSKRVFILYNETEEHPEIKTFEYDAERKELFIRFVFDIPADKKFDYAADNEKRITTWIANECKPLFMPLLGTNVSKDPKKSLTLLGKHLKAYVAKNTFDYFIHKDLGNFLSRELDFYIKNEVMHLDDVDSTDENKAETWLAQVRAIKRVGKVIIDFLAQIENFQKKLWLKKKFVIDTNYCITLDRVPEALYEEIARNQLQWQDWAKWGVCDVEFGNGFTWDNVKLPVTDITVYFDKKHEVAYSCDLTGEKLVWIENADLKKETNRALDLATPLSSVEFLKKHSNLVLDTCFFSEAFKEGLIESIDNFDEQCDGLLIHSENFQALQLLQTKYRENIKCIYIDPPYNTGNNDFPYKDGYKHSSWLSMLWDRTFTCYSLMTKDALYSISLDYNELSKAELMFSHFFGEENFRNTVTVARVKKSIKEHEFVRSLNWEHSYIHIFGCSNKTQLNVPLKKQKKTKQKEDKEVWHAFDVPGIRRTMEYKIFGRKPPEGRHWMYSEKETMKMLQRGELRASDTGCGVQYKVPDNNGEILVGTNWMDFIEGDANGGMDTSKNPKIMERIITCVPNNTAITILDYFAGSGTTAHAVMNLNREDGGKRKYILVEMGAHFDTVLKPRLEKVAYAKDWKDGKPVSHTTGISHCFKYMSLENYEDALSNIELPPDEKARPLLKMFGDEYLVKYMLDLDATGSILNLDAFKEPFAYQLKVTERNETKTTCADLVETFNYLIGLTINHLHARRSFNVTAAPGEEYEGAVGLVADVNGKYTFRQVEGTLRDGQRALIIWRNISDNLRESNAALDAFFTRYRINPADRKFDVIYINGDNNVESLRKDNETWKARMIEPEFKARMFEEA